MQRHRQALFSWVILVLLMKTRNRYDRLYRNVFKNQHHSFY